MSDIFLSYAKEDKGRAKALAETLQSYGWSVWWDAEIPPGQTWDEMIEQELTTAKCVIVMWSQQSIGKHWVRTEATLALERGVLVPVLIENVLPPLAFRRIQAAPLFDWNRQREHDGFDQLLGVIERLAAAPQLAQSRCKQEVSGPAAGAVFAGVEAASSRVAAPKPQGDQHAVPSTALAPEAPFVAPLVAPIIEKRTAPASTKQRRTIVAGLATFLICVAVLGYIFHTAIIPPFPSPEPAESTLTSPSASITPKPAASQANPKLGDLGQTSSDAPERKEGGAGPPNFTGDTSPSGATTPTTGAAVQTPIAPPVEASAFPAEPAALPAETAPITRSPNSEEPAKARETKKVQQQRKTSTAAHTAPGYESVQPSITKKQGETKPRASGWKIIRD